MIEELAAILADCRVTPPIPADRESLIPHDEIDDAAPARTLGPHESVPPAEPVALFLEYMDLAGTISRRTVTVRQVIGIPMHTILCFCHEQDRLRHFRLDRILAVTGPETAIAYALSDLPGLLTGTGLSSVSMESRRAVNLLIFLLRNNALSQPVCWQAIDQLIAILVHQTGQGEEIWARARGLARQIAPDGNDFIAVLKVLAQVNLATAIGKWLVRSVRTTVEEKWITTPEDLAWLGKVLPYLSQVARGDALC